MYFYSLYGYEENYIIQHEQKFNEKEFEKMCKETPISGSESCRYYTAFNIIQHLKKKYRFKDLKTETGFFIDIDIK
jgi:hypothetical protein